MTTSVTAGAELGKQLADGLLHLGMVSTVASEPCDDAGELVIRKEAVELVRIETVDDAGVG